MKLIKHPLFLGLFLAACNSAPPHIETKKEVSVKEENVTYSLDTVKMNGFVAYDENNNEKRPIIIVIPEWWGLNDYARSRAKQLAELGYLAIAIDLYGNGLTADNPQLAGQLAGPFYQDPAMAKARFDAALASIKTHAMADTARIAAIGYCFGGGMALNIARLGENLKGVVSFHGSLIGTPMDKNLLKAKVLVCHGEADQFVKAEEVSQFKHQMDSIGANYTFKSYKDATHAFSNPNATAMGQKFSIPIAYNAAADTASWNEMKLFLKDVFQ